MKRVVLLLVYGVQSSLSYFDKSKIIICTFFFLLCLLEGLWIVR